jgi:hypothetical protein
MIAIHANSLVKNKKGRVGGLLLRSLMVSLVLRSISPQERQERVSPGGSRGDVASVSGGGGRGGNWLRRIAFRSEVRGEGGSCGGDGTESSFAVPTWSFAA